MTTLADSAFAAAPSSGPSTVEPATVTDVYRVPEGVFRRIALVHARELLRQARTRYAKQAYAGEYRQTTGAALPEARSLGSTYQLLVAEGARLDSDHPVGRPVHGPIAGLAPVLDLTTGVDELWSAYSGLIDALADVLDVAADVPQCVVLPAVGGLEIRLSPSVPGPPASLDAAPVELDAAAFVDRIGELTTTVRRARRRPSRSQLVAEQVAFDCLARGLHGDRPARPYGTSGFRRHQTYMSVTDPGEGHLDGTTRNMSYLDGTIVHIEHLERGSFSDRSRIEPYRIPHPLTVARVRQLVGTDAPTSSYVGRPVFEGAVEESMLKATYTVAAACSALFAEGLSECKLAIESMTARQAITFMRVIRASVRRDPFTQVLSAAFNLNTPILDDRAENREPTMVTERLALGLLGVALTAAGGFDKVTWDGTADTYPSRCVLEQISFQEAVVLVHRAHELGLQTYFSAGFRLHNLASAVETGVDGVGVGGAQILRHMDADTGFHGPFLEENIRDILAARTGAEHDLAGRAALALARLDRMAYERSITPRNSLLRHKLFEALCSPGRDPARIRRLLADLAVLMAAPPDTEHPLVSWAERLRRAGRHSLAARACGWADWKPQLDLLNEAVGRGDLHRLELLLLAATGRDTDDR